MINRLLGNKAKKVLVIGDSMLDYYAIVSPKSISLEHLGITYLDDNSGYYALGGAANVAVNIANFDICVDFFQYVVRIKKVESF